VSFNIKDFTSKQECETILKRLVQINSVNLPGNEMNIVKVILSMFPLDKIQYKVIDHGDNRGSLVISIKGVDSSSSVAFVGHIDTVPADNLDEWRYPPFEGVVDGEYMYGRGTSDMKGGVSAMILTALFFIENSIVPAWDLQFCFTADEEIGGKGIVSIRDSGLIDNVKEVFICEPTAELIGLAEKGALWLRISVKGKAAHGSMPHIGINAADKLICFIEKLKSSIDTSSVHHLLGRTTVEVTQLLGGIKTNVIPANATATLDIRTIPGYKHEEIINSAKDIAKLMMDEKPELYIDIEVENNRTAVETLEDNLFVKKIKKVYEKLGYDYGCKGLNFYTDASQLIPQMKIPFVILGPGEDTMAHQKDERIKISSVSKLTEIYIEYLLRL
jgi:succinyl-diaminopimelate desuccinylase